MPRELTIRQRRFFAAMQRGLSGTDAAIEAGYSPHSARSRAHVLLRNPLARAELDRIRDELATEAQYNGTKCMAELDYAIAFAIQEKKPGDYVKAVELRARLAGLLRDKLDITVERVDLSGALHDAKSRTLRLRCDSGETIEGDFVPVPGVAASRPIDTQSVTPQKDRAVSADVERALWSGVRPSFQEIYD